MVIAIAARFSKVTSVVEMPGQLLVSVHWNIRLLLLCTPINYIRQTGKKRDSLHKQEQCTAVPSN